MLKILLTLMGMLWESDANSVGVISTAERLNCFFLDKNALNTFSSLSHFISHQISLYQYSIHFILLYQY